LVYPADYDGYLVAGVHKLRIKSFVHDCIDFTELVGSADNIEGWGYLFCRKSEDGRRMFT
jgi:hypothetical protein